MSQLPKSTDENLLVGTKTNDDAAIYKINDEIGIVLTVDFFPPIVDDPFTYGEISAANSLSDVYAMGGTPIVALNIVGFPDNLDLSILGEILKGGASKAAEAGIVIAGGHTVADNEPKYGLSVTGTLPLGSQITNAGAKPGDCLILTKPIGTGVITTAGKQGVVNTSVMGEAINVMTSLNKAAAEAMVEVGVNSCSDVTGFGLLGHLLEMTEGSRVSATINRAEVPVIDGTLDLISEGIAPGGTLRNLEAIEPHVSWSKNISQNDRVLLADAQTSGGLLISVSEPNTKRLLNVLEDKGIDNAAVIGTIKEYNRAENSINVY